MPHTLAYCALIGKCALIRSNTVVNRALDKREYLVIIRDNFCQFCTKSYVVTPHVTTYDFNEKIEKLSLNFHQILLLSRALNLK